MANFATIEARFAVTAGMEGPAKMFALSVVATLQTGTSVLFVVIGFVGEANIGVIPLIVAVLGGVPLVGLVTFCKVGKNVLSSQSWRGRPVPATVLTVRANSMIGLGNMSVGT